LAVVLCSAVAILVFVAGAISVPSKEDGLDAATAYFEAIRDKDYDRALSFYSPAFFEKTSREDWLVVLKRVNAKLGDLQTYELQDWCGRPSNSPT
ncbi:MAG: hypothetical protein Q7O66_22310, partial [Dehalococcoidia bacterium]|nr:hypothetical protein [Dehalococcoidia bacterium]